MRFSLALLFAAALLNLVDVGQSAAQLTVTNVESAEVRQVSLSRPDGIIAARREASSGSQIRVRVQYLYVDDDTRKLIYAGFPLTAVTNTISDQREAATVDLHDADSPSMSSSHVSSPSRVTTCVLDATQVQSVLQIAAQSSSSDISNAPSIMLLGGKEAEMNDIVQHPFVIDIRAKGESVEPTVQSFDEGTRLRLLASPTEAGDETDTSAEAIKLTCQLLTSRLLEVKSDQLFGIQEGPVPVQTPVHQVNSAVASQQLAKGQTLFFDPHVTKTKSVASESSVPVLGRLPYVGRSFRNTSVAQTEQHMLVLLQPSLERNPR